MKDEKFPFVCPICGRKTDYPVLELVEGAVLTCSFCKLRLTLHGHRREGDRAVVKSRPQKNERHYLRTVRSELWTRYYTRKIRRVK